MMIPLGKFFRSKTMKPEAIVIVALPQGDRTTPLFTLHVDHLRVGGVSCRCGRIIGGGGRVHLGLFRSAKAFLLETFDMFVSMLNVPLDFE